MRRWGSINSICKFAICIVVYVVLLFRFSIFQLVHALFIGEFCKWNEEFNPSNTCQLSKAHTNTNVSTSRKKIIYTYVIKRERASEREREGERNVNVASAREICALCVQFSFVFFILFLLWKLCRQMKNKICKKHARYYYICNLTN